MQGSLDLVQEERIWLQQKVLSFLQRTRAVLQCVGNTSLNEDSTLEALVNLLSPEQVLARLGGDSSVEGKVFRAWFDETEWEEAKQSALCIAAADAGAACRVRLGRQKKMLSACAVPVVGPLVEHKELWLSCAEEVKRVCEAFGIALQRAAAAKAIPIVQQSSPKLSARRRNRPEESEDGQSMPVHAKPKRIKVVFSTPVSLSSSESIQQQEEQHQQQCVSEEEEEEEEMVEQPAEDPDDVIRQLLAHARGEVDNLFLLVHEKSGKTVEAGEMIPPSSTLATAAEGAKLLKDADFSCFRHDEAVQPLERLGLLSKWWRLVKRCYSIVALFDRLAASKGKQGIVVFYNESVRPVSGSCSYVHATRLERIGHLVLRFPRLLYQTQFTSLGEWFQDVQSTLRPLLDSLEHLLSAEDLAFWAMEDNPAVCNECDKQSEGLWNCSECLCWFHEGCAGYEAGSLSLGFPLKDAQVLETRVICNSCLEKNELDHDYVNKETHEKRVVASFLNADGCPFVLRKVAPDGTCCFRVLWDFAMAKLECHSSFAVFCRQLAGAALEASVEAVNEMGQDGIELESVTQLKRLKKSRNPERDLQRGAWVKIEAQQVLRGFVRMFVNACVRRFAVHGDVLAEREVYGGGGQELCVLQWNVSLHFDELCQFFFS